MIPKEMIEWLSQKLEIENNSLVEKDLYLQSLLLSLAKSEYFSKNFVFKGGTCLIKTYFGYYRFSEDLDFTWVDQKAFEGKTEKQIRKLLSMEIDKIMKLLEAVAKELGLEFKAKKSDRRYVQLGSSNRFVTFLLWYTPETEQSETFIKIQINFVERIIHTPKQKIIKAIAEKHKKEIEFLWPDHSERATKSVGFHVYDLEEIAAEKIRALLTRRGFKARDIIDLYVLSKKGITINSVKKMAIEKTVSMLKYLKYGENLKNKTFEEEFKLGEEQRLIIKCVGKDFKKFAKKTFTELNELAEEARNIGSKDLRRPHS